MKKPVFFDLLQLPYLPNCFIPPIVLYTVMIEITRFIIALGPDSPRANKSRHLTHHCGISNKCQ